MRAIHRRRGRLDGAGGEARADGRAVPPPPPARRRGGVSAPSARAAPRSGDGTPSSCIADAAADAAVECGAAADAADGLPARRETTGDAVAGSRVDGCRGGVVGRGGSVGERAPPAWPLMKRPRRTPGEAEEGSGPIIVNRW